MFMKFVIKEFHINDIIHDLCYLYLFYDRIIKLHMNPMKRANSFFVEWEVPLKSFTMNECNYSFDFFSNIMQLVIVLSQKDKTII